jgi:hypothetical protein
MSDTWVDPRSDPYFQGLPTQQDYYANEYGQGFGNRGFKTPQDEVESNIDWAKEYFKMTGTYLPDHIPGIPDEVKMPEYDKPVFRSDFVSSNQGDKALNEVYRLVQSGDFGVEEAISAVLGTAEENGWAMPMEADQGDRLMNYDGAGNPVVQYTQDQYNQAAAAGINLSTPKGRTRYSGNEPDPSGQVLPPAPTNFNETLFRENATKFVQESEQQNREQGDRDAAMAEYQDYLAPRYGFDFEGMMESGGSGGLQKTDYAAKDSGGGERYDRWAAGANQGSRASGVNGQPMAVGRPDSPSGYSSNPRPQDGGNQNYARDSRAAQRTNEANRVSNEKFQEAYRSGLAEYAKDNALASKKDQRYSMMDQYLASIAYGGDQ